MKAILCFVVATTVGCAAPSRSVMCVEVNDVILSVACVDDEYVDPCTGAVYECTVGADTCPEVLFSEECQ